MALNLAAKGKTIGPLERSYEERDVILYALGVGAGVSELEYCYEKRLKVIPSFSAALIFEFFFHAAAEAGVNLAGVLHGEQALEFHRPLPTAGTLRTEGAITDFFDKGADKGALVVAKSETSDAELGPLFTSAMTLFGRLDGGFGGPNAPAPAAAIPDAPPDATIPDRPGPDQPLLYRLSGDLFDLHVDPEFAARAGFERPIMHGLCTHGFACRALIRALVPGAPERLRKIGCRFSRPLYPGVPIETRVWRTEAGSAAWRVVNAETGDVVIDRGTVEFD
jgi:acyl dehydratase